VCEGWRMAAVRRAIWRVAGAGRGALRDLSVAVFRCCCASMPDPTAPVDGGLNLFFLCALACTRPLPAMVCLASVGLGWARRTPERDAHSTALHCTAPPRNGNGRRLPLGIPHSGTAAHPTRALLRH
jgi:hypothetical protein